MVDEVVLSLLQEQQLRELGVLPGQAAALLRRHPDFSGLLLLARYGADLAAAGMLLGQDARFDEVLRMAACGRDLAAGRQAAWQGVALSPAPDGSSLPAAGGEAPCSDQEWQELFDYGLRGREMRAALRLRDLGCSHGQVLSILDSGAQVECAARCHELGLGTEQVEHLAAMRADLGAVCLLLEEDASGEDVFLLAATGMDLWLALDLAEAGGSARQARELHAEGLSLVAAAAMRGDGLGHGEAMAALRQPQGPPSRQVRVERRSAIRSSTQPGRGPATTLR